MQQKNTILAQCHTTDFDELTVTLLIGQARSNFFVLCAILSIGEI